jgi:DnaJ-domain-containing protein 1
LTDPHDFCTVLEVDRDATQAEISQTYRTLLRRHHRQAHLRGHPGLLRHRQLPEAQS